MLKTIGIDELEPGMYVDSIARQTGKIKIRSQGRVSSQTMIHKLKEQGILALVIDAGKQLPAEPIPVEHYSSEPASVSRLSGKRVSFDAEIERAKALYAQGKALQKKLFNGVKRGLPLDLAIPAEFSNKLVESLDRHPDALLCLTRIRQKDSYLLEHSLNVSILLAHFAKQLGLPSHQVSELTLAGFLHDIGKIQIADAILHKPGRLTDEEMQIMRGHVSEGVQALEMTGLPGDLIRTVAEHHERLDGGGYPKGVGSEDISLYGRMVAIVDTYDAITADRCYKAGQPAQTAHKILLKASPREYDQVLVQKFIRCMGIYPVGSLVRLSNSQVAMVCEQCEDNPLKPRVKVFFSLKANHYLPPRDIALSESDNSLKIDQAVTAGELGLDFNRFFDQAIAV
ncbi:HD domain-containing phosphohydrolase [Bowmanella dokdonensis]|uniref:HD-GYP domain-containing protein n=1 Tax=Bowmanella dokdonensis TaxID=751969 RepID=A0A939IPW1_9ALTE|nr:HD-GYP domain-containing protein [Bowmanella dokdonensis]